MIPEIKNLTELLAVDQDLAYLWDYVTSPPINVVVTLHLKKDNYSKTGLELTADINHEVARSNLKTAWRLKCYAVRGDDRISIDGSTCQKDLAAACFDEFFQVPRRPDDSSISTGWSLVYEAALDHAYDHKNDESSLAFTIFIAEKNFHTAYWENREYLISRLIGNPHRTGYRRRNELKKDELLAIARRVNCRIPSKATADETLLKLWKHLFEAGRVTNRLIQESNPFSIYDHARVAAVVDLFEQKDVADRVTDKFDRLATAAAGV